MTNLNLEELRDVADKHYQGGRFQDAIESYDGVLQINPVDLHALGRRAELSSALGDYETALQVYDRIIAIQPREVWAYIDKGDVLAWLARYNDAVACYDQALSIDAKNTAIWRKKGLALIKLDRLQEALASYDQALQIDPNDSQNLSGKADVLLSSKERFSDALDLYQKAQASPGSSFQAPDWVMRADSLYDAEQFTEAIVCCDKAIASDPNYIWAWRGKGLALRSQQRLDEALHCFDEALRIEPENAAVLVDKGGILSDKGKHAEATSCYDKALAIDPRNYFALINKGVVCQNLAQYEKAIEWYDKAIEVEADRPFPWESKGACLDQLGRLDGAIKCYDRAIKLEPKSLWAWNNKGWIYARQQKHEEALKFFDQAIQIDNRESLLWVNKSDSLRQLGRLDDAVRCLESALAVVSEQREVLLSLASLWADYKSDDERALECYQRILKLHPHDIPAQAGMVEILIKSGRYTEGRKRALEVARASTDSDLQCVIQYLVVVSYALEGAEMSAEFQKLMEHFRSHSGKSIAESTNWNYRGLTNTIKKSGVALETKFLLLTLIDLQLGKIDASKLSFSESLTAGMSAAPKTNRA